MCVFGVEAGFVSVLVDTRDNVVHWRLVVDIRTCFVITQVCCLAAYLFAGMNHTCTCAIYYTLTSKWWWCARVPGGLPIGSEYKYDLPIGRYHNKHTHADTDKNCDVTEFPNMRDQKPNYPLTLLSRDDSAPISLTFAFPLVLPG